jgi:PHD/YefM family antitoxin component YafN of YafNO toxin-antitoxin module
MPTIRPSADLRNNYSEISNLCHQFNEPVFITKNGSGDLAVMSMETYEMMAGKYRIFSRIDEGLEQIEQGKKKPMKEALKNIKDNISK